jgi:hypothetical protein
MNAYPNPTSDITNFSFTAAKSSVATATNDDLTGTPLSAKQIHISNIAHAED